MARRDSYFRARESRRCVKLQYGTCRVSSAWRRLLDEISLARMPATWPMVEECRSQFLHPTSESSRRNKRFKHIRSGIELSSTGRQLRDSSRYHPTFATTVPTTLPAAHCPLDIHHSQHANAPCSLLPPSTPASALGSTVCHNRKSRDGKRQTDHANSTLDCHSQLAAMRMFSAPRIGMSVRICLLHSPTRVDTHKPTRSARSSEATRACSPRSYSIT